VLEFNPVNPLAASKPWLINNRDVFDGDLKASKAIDLQSRERRAPMLDFKEALGRMMQRLL